MPRGGTKPNAIRRIDDLCRPHPWCSRAQSKSDNRGDNAPTAALSRRPGWYPQNAVPVNAMESIPRLDRPPPSNAAIALQRAARVRTWVALHLDVVEECYLFIVVDGINISFPTRCPCEHPADGNKAAAGMNMAAGITRPAIDHIAVLI
jgi:hypothetical protein